MGELFWIIIRIEKSTYTENKQMEIDSLLMGGREHYQSSDECFKQPWHKNSNISSLFERCRHPGRTVENWNRKKKEAQKMLSSQ